MAVPVWLLRIKVKLGLMFTTGTLIFLHYESRTKFLVSCSVTKPVMEHLSAQCITTSSSCIHCRWITKTSSSLDLGAPRAFWIMQNEVGFSERLLTKGRVVKSSKKI